MSNLGFNIYIIFTISWFLHLGTRFPILGLIRFDLLLVSFLFILSLQKQNDNIINKTQTNKLIKILLIYSIITIPFVEWPGSVINTGIESLIKAVIFYYFTISFVQTEEKIEKFIIIFIGCQLFRIVEPLYLHITEGYWGEMAYMGNAEFLDRLSGAPLDTVNPNGLAFIICTVLPFLFLRFRFNWLNKLFCLCLIPICIYALLLTGSRSGLMGLLIIYFVFIFKSNKRIILIITGICIVIIGFPLLNPDQQDRYLSIIGMGQKNLATAKGREKGVIEDFIVALRRPIFGHGIGTSREANAHYRGIYQVSHNFYAETAQELGFTGLLIILFYIVSLFSVLAQSNQFFRERGKGGFLYSVNEFLQVWLWLNVLFSFVSYGLTSYEWYLLGGIAVVVLKIIQEDMMAEKQ